MRRMTGILAALVVVVWQASALAQTDPLPSWNDGAAKQAIIEFVEATTTDGGPDFVPPPERIATFDQDGTLWVEHPIYSQLVFVLDSVPALVKAKPELADQEPFKTVLTGDLEAVAKLPKADLEKLLMATLTGMSVDDFRASAAKWMAEAKDHRWKRPYTDLTYQPMQEVLQYLRANGYKTYIVTGGGQDFVRVLRRGDLRRAAGAGDRQRQRNQLRLRQGRQAVPDQGPQAADQRQRRRQARSPSI